MADVLIVLMVAAAIAGIATLIAVVIAIVYGVRRISYAIRGETYVPLLSSGEEPEYVHQGVESGATFESVRAIFKRYAYTEGVGPYARAGMDALGNCERKTANFYAVLDSKFQPGTLSWDKFSVAAEATKQALLKNCAVLANAVQVFDAKDYRQLKQIERRSSFRKNEQLDPSQAERLKLLNAKLVDMQACLQANDQILLELDRLSNELDKLDDAGLSSESERLIEEIRTLIDETKFYRQQ